MLDLRIIVIAGLACLGTAVILTFIFLPREFGLLADKEFMPEIVSVHAEREGVTVTVKPKAVGRTVFMEWKQTSP